jgi:hypothetical protein
VKAEFGGSVEEPGKGAGISPAGSAHLPGLWHEVLRHRPIAGSVQFVSFGELIAGNLQRPTSRSAAGSTEETVRGSQVRRFEHYELMLDEDGRLIELDRGAMGVTYKAFDVDLRCPVWSERTIAFGFSTFLRTCALGANRRNGR